LVHWARAGYRGEPAEGGQPTFKHPQPLVKVIRRPGVVAGQAGSCDVGAVGQVGEALEDACRELGCLTG
jgi:hypothetical protein